MNRRNKLIGILIIFITGIILLDSFLAYQFISDKIKKEPGVGQVVEITKENNIIQQQRDELDALRRQFQEQYPEQATSSVKDQMKALSALRNQVLKQKGVHPQKTIKEQIQELETLRLSAQAGSQINK